MALTVEDDFRDFVAACWPDLEAAALLVCLDPVLARQVTTDALADLHQHWREALDDGRPGARARRAVLSRAMGGQPGIRPGASRPVAATAAPPRRDDPDDPDDPDHPDDLDEPDPDYPAAADPAAADPAAADPAAADPVARALAAVLRAASPVERALVAGRSVWSLTPEEVADLVGVPAAPVHEAESMLRERLLDAHSRARAAQGLGPAGWMLDRAVDDAVDVLLRGLAPPPDPALLVAARRRTVRRRSVLVAGAGALVVVSGMTAWIAGRDAVPASASRLATPTTPGPNDPAWSTSASWPPRGALASDVDIRALLIARASGASRLLWADDIGRRRVVVAAALDASQPAGTGLRAWHGPRGADPRSLVDLRLQSATIPNVTDVVALTLPDGEGDDAGGIGRRSSLLVVLSRPAVRTASFSRVVRPTRAGGVERQWAALPLVGGVGWRVLSGRVSPATRVRVSRYDGPPATTEPLWLWVGLHGGDPATFVRAVDAHVAGATGIPVSRLRTEVVADSPVSGSILDPSAVSATGGDGRVVAVRTTTPAGAVLSSVVVTDDGRGRGGAVALRVASVLPAERAHDPVVEQVADLQEDVGRFLVVAPGAARVQLLATSPSAYPVSKVVETKGAAAAVVPVVNAAQASGFRVVTRGDSGQVLFDDVPAVPRLLLDLWP